MEEEEKPGEASAKETKKAEQPADAVSAPQGCQNCGAQGVPVSDLDTGLRLLLSKSGRDEIPEKICEKCATDLRKIGAEGLKEVDDQAATRQALEGMWNSRLQAVRAGRHSLERKEYAEAAVSYEKYLKVLSLVTQKDKKDLDPKDFNDHPQEITILASVLWDLVIIYDSHPKFATRQMENVELLARFLRFSPMYNTVIRKAELEYRRARNPNAYATLLRLCDVNATRCFVANAAFATHRNPTVRTLCLFRDEILKASPRGRALVCYYYLHSPNWAERLHHHAYLKPVVRSVLRGVAGLIRLIFSLPVSPRS